ncbi:2-polyprenyl-3-methyl-5-hydroxy-6-metoxy-1,4-benzoquinol methylase [Paenibacillus favisporus]|uniref:2-polyprenyl-3-methyl-5-hydroxy-6-metoxy-1, 4-benzoquinol methylase n=1 Tax=Paenibacillus favisporus TaxID=221028 RepID=A0ABV2EZG6_9BACL
MLTAVDFHKCLQEYLDRFVDLVNRYDQTASHFEELQLIIDNFSGFVTDKENSKAWDQLKLDQSDVLACTAGQLRAISARCVAIMEKYRAVRLQQGHAEITEYFKNIEACIEKEFGSFQITSASKVLMVGSGSFPMTPLLIAKRTGAEVVGIDIDEEAIALGSNVVKQLGHGLNIRLENKHVEQLEHLKGLTHIIFSSTVEQKYDILDQLYPLTSDEAVVAMRYGDGLKSVFNYPLKPLDGRTWKIAEYVLRPDDVFDIALYQK